MCICYYKCSLSTSELRDNSRRLYRLLKTLYKRKLVKDVYSIRKYCRWINTLIRVEYSKIENPNTRYLHDHFLGKHK